MITDFRDAAAAAIAFAADAADYRLISLRRA